MNYAMYSLLCELKRQSICQDKQVACILTDESDHILSVGINKVINCVKCNIGERTAICHSIHAENIAVTNIRDRNIERCHRAYVSLYPCPECQILLNDFVDEIVVFNKQHKECVIDEDKIQVVGDLAMDLVDVNGDQKQISVIIGELGELITIICDYFYRRHERSASLHHLMTEIADAELMIQCLFAILTKAAEDALTYYDPVKRAKLRKVWHSLSSGVIKGGSPFDKSFQDKEIY